MRDVVRAYIDKYQLLTVGKPVLVGVSGGADSIALLTVLVELGYSCIVGHCNFHLRGEESMRDECFTETYARKLGLPFVKVDFNTRDYAAEHHLSVEMAARELRYAWFEEMRCVHDAQAIAVAHHRDDNVETVLMNLIRGSGIRGMSGIRPKNGFVIRPLLPVTRQEILQWLAERQLEYVTDSTNLSAAYTRNFIRLRVLPLLETINPSVRTAINRTAEHLAETESLFAYVMADARKRVFEAENRLSIKALMQYPSPKTVLFELLKAFHFTPSSVDEIFLSLNKESGKLFFSSSHRLVKDRDCLLLSPLAAAGEKEVYFLTGEEGCWSGPIDLAFSRIVRTEELHIQKDKDIAYFDLDKLKFPLVLRHWQQGDWFVPFGMQGRKKLSDYFSDKKFSRLEKEQVWLLCSGDEVIWIVGERSDNRFRVECATKRCLVVNFFRKRVE